MKCKNQNKIGEEKVVTNGIHKNTYELFFEDKDNLSEEEKLTPEQRHAINEIEYYTQNKFYRLKYRIIKYIAKLITNSDYYNIKYDKKNKLYTYFLPNGLIVFDIFSHHCDKPACHFLESNARYGKCHSLSIYHAKIFTNSKVVTGYLSSRSDERILHSVVEVTKSDGEVVYVDFTKNLIMLKEQYISLFNFIILNEISSPSDDPELLDLLPDCLKPYVLFQDELEKDFSKVKSRLK